ncbi:M23 family metallopeptidase [Thiomicrorhabdus arctica]|uniref:M23 family metallopeptidase n=1 Tax=Thiomicrorhabdus arctica TaxID=131540 RepID=UPI00035F1D6A|nr:M23 family metallopeptidase [Thiomicrorhabdus arctica]
MRNHFTITISDVYGTHEYSFKQFIRKFIWILFAVFIAVWTVGGISIWWLNQKANNDELVHKASVKAFTASLEKTRSDYESLLVEKTKLEQDFLSTRSQIAFLDQALQGLEELVGEGDSESEVDVPPLPLDERVKRVQLDSLGKNIMMSMVPSGPAVANYRGLSSKYGRRIHPITGKIHLHGGLDYRGKTGAAVIATADGVVKYSAMNEESGFGNLVTLVHANGFMTRYGHLSKRTVKLGDYVRKGEKIGEIGNTGRSTGPHLHYEVWFLYKRLNPQAFNDWSLGKYDKIFTKVKGVPWGSLSQAVDMLVKKVEKQLLLKGVSLAVKSPI